MPQIADQVYFWLDGHRLSQWATLQDAEDEKGEVTFTPAESKRIKGLPAKHMASFSITAQDYDAPTMAMLGKYDANTEIAFMMTLNVAADQPAIMYRVRTMSNQQHQEGDVLALHTHRFNASQGGSQLYGKNLYPHTTNVTAPVNGSTINFEALSSTQSLLVMQHIEAVSGTGNFSSKIVNNLGGVPADVHTFTLVAHTSVPDAQFALINGPLTPIDYRLEITAISGGTWNVQVAAVVIDET